MNIVECKRAVCDLLSFPPLVCVAVCCVGSGDFLLQLGAQIRSLRLTEAEADVIEVLVMCAWLLYSELISLLLGHAPEVIEGDARHGCVSAADERMLGFGRRPSDRVGIWGTTDQTAKSGTLSGQHRPTVPERRFEWAAPTNRARAAL